MGKKLIEKTGSELFASLVNIAVPVGNLAKDEHLFEILEKCTLKAMAKSGKIAKNKIAYFMGVYAEIVPLLFGKDHLEDIVAILAEVEGTTAAEMLNMDGAQLMSDAISAWKEQIGPFFQRSGLMASTEL